MLPFLKSAFLLHHKFKGFLQKLTSVDHAARPVVNSRYQNPLFLKPNNKSNGPQTSSTEKWDQPNRTLTHALVQTMQPIPVIRSHYKNLTFPKPNQMFNYRQLILENGLMDQPKGRLTPAEVQTMRLLFTYTSSAAAPPLLLDFPVVFQRDPTVVQMRELQL